MENLVIDGKTFAPKKPTVKMWRDLVEMDEKSRENGLDLSARVNDWIDIISAVYGASTAELEALPMEDVFPIFNECAKYVFGSALARLGKLPNDGAAEEPQT